MSLKYILLLHHGDSFIILDSVAPSSSILVLKVFSLLKSALAGQRSRSCGSGHGVALQDAGQQGVTVAALLGERWLKALL